MKDNTNNTMKQAKKQVFKAIAKELLNQFAITSEEVNNKNYSITLQHINQGQAIKGIVENYQDPQAPIKIIYTNSATDAKEKRPA